MISIWVRDIQKCLNIVMNKNIIPYGLTSQHTPVTKRAGSCKKDRTSAVFDESFQPLYTVPQPNHREPWAERKRKVL